ncbi:MAG: thioredoxin [Bdellovibrio sp.]|nr:thioredoxin [Bdellovibrio sp.]
MSSLAAITDSTFNSVVLNSSEPVLVDFWAQWCRPCHGLTPKLEEIAQEFENKLKVVKLNIEENQETASKYGIRSLPAMVLFSSGQEIGQLIGNHPKDAIVYFLTNRLTP